MIDQQTAEAASSTAAEDSSCALAALRDAVGELQLPQIAHGRRTVIVLEGPEGAGKKFVLRQLAAALDPCRFAVHETRYDRRQAADGHWLARFWRQLPAAGDTSMFLHSWYRRVLDDQLLGLVDERSAARAFDEINEFEAQQRDYGTVLVKLYFSVEAEVQERRLKERSCQPWADQLHPGTAVGVGHPGYAQAVEQLRANSDTRWSPWRTIDGNDEVEAAIAALSALANAWAAAGAGGSSGSAMRERNRAA